MSFDLRRFTPTLTVPALALAATFVGCGDGGGGGGGGAATGGTKPDATVTGGTRSCCPGRRFWRWRIRRQPP